MASQITHVVYGDKFLKRRSEWDRSEFLIGTVFPDIRYLKVIDRGKTHISGLKLDEVLEEVSAFDAGKLFHSWLDEQREDYVVRNNLYHHCPQSSFMTETLKLLEDEVLYDQESDWSGALKSFDQVLQVEEDSGVSKGDILKWHGLMQGYFEKPPSDQSRTVVIQSLGFSKEVADKMNADLALMRANFQLVDLMLGFAHKFEKLTDG